MALWQWSTTPANNASAGAIDWAEGQPPSTVNDSARQMMADVAAWFQYPEWLNYGLVPVYVNGTTFTVPGSQGGTFTVGRRVRAVVTAGAIYGTISASVYTSLTTVSVAWDSGSLDTGLSEVDVHIINPSLHQNFTLERLTLNEPGNSSSTLAINGAGDFNGANIALYGNGTTTPNKFIRAINGVFQIANSALNSYLLNLDDSGNLQALGNITAGGNLTANSDERLKANWAPLREDFIDELASVRSGTFSRLDCDLRQVGVGAQSLRNVLPEAVQENENGVLSVAYGQAALVACVELAKEVRRLRALLEPLR